MNRKISYDLIVIGAGAAGIMAAIRAARDGNRVLLLEKMGQIGTKLKATGGGRCNLTNTLDNESFMKQFGREGRFMSNALKEFGSEEVRKFFEEIGVKTHAPDGFRFFPLTHNALTVVNALRAQIEILGIEVRCNRRVESIEVDGQKVSGVCCSIEDGARKTKEYLFASNIVVATGGRGYPMLGTEGDGYRLAQKLGHHVTELYPAMIPLRCKERWVAACRADTIPKVRMVIDLKKYRKLGATGDLIFTKNGIRGPVVLDFSREVTPLLSKLSEVPIKINLVRGLNEEQIRECFKEQLRSNPNLTTLELVGTLLPKSVAQALCSISKVDPRISISRQNGASRDSLYKMLAWTPLTVTGHDGFEKAMVTRGGISLKEVDPCTMQSRKISGLYFCGEILDLDGPCGGYNLQWSFASGYLSGAMK